MNISLSVFSFLYYDTCVTRKLALKCPLNYTNKFLADVVDDDDDTGEGSGNNYAYLVTDEASKEAVIIDPANPPE